MRKILLYIATSLNGKIADSEGGVDWLESLPNPDKLDYGYEDMYESIDTTIMGNNTYSQIRNWGIDFPYPDKKNFVLTRKKRLKNTKYVDFISSNHIDFIKELKRTEGKDIWLIGGGQINSMLLNEELIDEIIVHIMPIVINGIDLFGGLPKETKLKLTATKTYPTDVVEFRYAIEKTGASNFRNYWDGE